MQESELQRYAREAFLQMDHGVKHLSMQQIVEMADGSAPRDAEVETHLSTCAPCRQQIREFERFAADCEHPIRGESNDRINQEWPGLRRRIWWHKATVTAPKWGSIAAGIVLAAGGWSGLQALMNSPERLLAKASSEQRTFPFRVAEGQYTPVAVQRGSGSAFNKPASLSEAEANLKKQLESNPDNPDALRLQGVAEMMEGQAGLAVQTLKKALDFHPQDARILADLGAAYALRGEGDDYSNALEYLSRSLDLRPRSREVIFNRALVLERMFLKDQAVLAWEAYLKLDDSSDWAKEARKHIADLQAEMKLREDGLSRIVDDPDKFLALAAAGSADAEAFLRDIAITKWLPRVHSDPRAREAIIQLGQILKERHGDSWLADVARDMDRSEMAEGFQQLADAREGNQSSRAQKALASAREAERSFVQAKSRPGVLWARFEEVVALRILLQSKECLPAAETLALDLDAHGYIFLRAHTRLDYVTCAMRVGRLSDARAILLEVKRDSETAGFGDAALRASAGYLETVEYVGLPSEIFARADEYLRKFWSGAYRPVRFRQLVWYLEVVAVRSGQNHAAWLLARSRVWAAISTSDPRQEAHARSGLAAAAQAVGEESEARENLEIADRLYAGLPVQFRTEPQAALAKVELDRGDVNAVLARLERLQPFDPSYPPNATTLTQYYSVLGEAYRQKGLLPEAIDAFHKSIKARDVESLASEPERAGLLKTIENSYRGLVAATLASSGNPSEAFGIWQSFRALDAVGNPGQIERGDVPVLSYLFLPGHTVTPKDATRTWTFFSRSAKAMESNQAELPDEIIAWLSRKDHVTLNRLSVSKDEVARTVRRFRSECSDEKTSERLLGEDARLLYKWMVEPFAAEFTEQDRNLIFELDGALAGVPVQALMSPDGRYLGERFSVLVSSGYATARRTVMPRRNASLLVVADPTLKGDTHARFPDLPGSLSEAKTILDSFPRAKILEGANATLDGLSAARPTVEIFHFAGHGDSDSENGALLFAPKDPKISDYELLRSADLLRQDWSRCSLVVLSACAAAAGELQGPHNPDSLVRAFTRAGVPRVAASLWNVDDEATAGLMGAFYGTLARGASPIEALRTAQRSVRQHSGWSHPYYWAGFQLFGTM